jgi:peptide/nickel transport system substrate-binding protein
VKRCSLRAVGAIAVLCVVAAGCGDDDDEDAGSTDTAVEDTAGTTDTAVEATAVEDTTAEDTAADSTPVDSAPVEAEACTEELAGGEVTMGVLTQPRALDPIVAAGAGTTGGIEMAAIYDTLVQYDPESGEYVPRVAESLEPNADFSEWTLTLRDGVTFGNGDPLTAEAVQASIARFQGEANTGPYRALSLTISATEVVDESTLVLTLTEGWAGFPFLLANSGGMIVNTAVADATGESFGTVPSGAGVGPFEIARFAPGEEIVLEPRADYWGGPVCLQQLRFIVGPSDAGTYEAFGVGDLQAASLRDPQTIATARDDGVTGLSNLQNAGNVLLINNGVRDTEPPTADVRLRRAIAAAIDVEAIDERVYGGTGLPTQRIIGETSRYAEGLEDLQAPAHDPDLARELVTEVQEETGWDGSLSLVCPAPREEAALAMQAQLNAVGFDIALEILPSTSELVDRVIVRADFELSCWGLNYLDSALWPTMNNTMRSDSPSNYGGYQDPNFDAGLVALRTAATLEEEQAAIVTLQEAWNDTVPAVILETIETTIILDEELQGVELTTNSIVLFADAHFAA